MNEWSGYSLTERDRRWNAVRQNAANAAVDCVLVPLCIEGASQHLSLEQWRGTRSDCRYLTQLENAAIVLPTDGRDPIVITDQPDRNAWLAETQIAPAGAGTTWGAAMTGALLELRMERARIGVSGLTAGRASHIRSVHGVVNHTAYAEVLRRLPDATFENGTDLVGMARYRKSEEEIACLRRAAEIASAGLDTMVQTARPGIPVRTLYTRVMRRMLELGSDYYPLALEVGPIGTELTWYENPPDDVLCSRTI